MTKTIAIGIAIIVAVNILGWVIVANQGQSPFDNEDLLVGSRAFSVPRRDLKLPPPREENAVPADVQKILTSAQQFTLLSIDPEYLSDEAKERLGADTLFHGFRILGKTEIQDPIDRASLARALVGGIADSDGLSAACFDPRHGIRATLDTETVDFVICYECCLVEIHKNGREIQASSTSRLPVVVFNRALQKAGLPMARSKR